MRGRTVVMAAWLLSVALPLPAGGVAELRLDAAAVADLLEAALPEPRRFDLPGIGPIHVTLGPVRSAAFRDHGVEASVRLAVDELGWEGDVRLRFVPGIERRTGTAQLVPEEVSVAGLPFDLDLAGWIRPATLPRTVRWDLEMAGARTLPVICYVQGIGVDEDRLRIELGLVAGADPTEERRR